MSRACWRFDLGSADELLFSIFNVPHGQIVGGFFALMYDSLHLVFSNHRALLLKSFGCSLLQVLLFWCVRNLSECLWREDLVFSWAMQ